MSETPPRPDGTDPRVLTPSDDEPEVKIAKRNTQAYHTADCRTIYRMRERGVGFKTVKLSVAEWRDLHECDICEREGAYDPDATPDRSGHADPEDAPGVAAPTCAAWRTYLGSGLPALELIDIVPYSETEVRRHLKGECAHEVSEPAYAFGWHPAPDPPAERDARPQTSVTAATCYALRDRLLDGERLTDAASALSMSDGTARNHARGRCEHHNSTPPLARGWHERE